MDIRVQLVGYKKATSQKTGKPYCQLFVLQDLNEREIQWGFVGKRLNDTYFLPDNRFSSVTPDMIMQDVLLTFVPGMDMKMHLDDIKLVK